jgi:hypothetical protein
MIYQMLYVGRFGGKMEDRGHSISIFNEHNRDVIESIPGDQLLVFDASSGWPRLCEFLEVEVPDRPFPVSNSSASFMQQRHELQ